MVWFGFGKCARPSTICELGQINTELLYQSICETIESEDIAEIIPEWDYILHQYSPLSHKPKDPELCCMKIILIYKTLRMDAPTQLIIDHSLLLFGPH